MQTPDPASLACLHGKELLLLDYGLPLRARTQETRHGVAHLALQHRVGPQNHCMILLSTHAGYRVSYRRELFGRFAWLAGFEQDQKGQLVAITPAHQMYTRAERICLPRVWSSQDATLEMGRGQAGLQCMWPPEAKQPAE